MYLDQLLESLDSELKNHLPSVSVLGEQPRPLRDHATPRRPRHVREDALPLDGAAKGDVLR